MFPIRSPYFRKKNQASCKYLAAIVAGVLLATGNGLAFATTTPPASKTSGQPQGKKQAKSCDPSKKDLSGCKIRFIIPPPQLIMESSSIEIGEANLPVAVRLYMIKNALHRGWSSSANDRNLMVCRWASDIKGSRIKNRIRCASNAAYAKEAEYTSQNGASSAEYDTSSSCASVPKIRAGLVDVSREMAACIMAEVADWANAHNPSRMMGAMSKLPRPGSDYTVRIKKKGQVVSKWVFEKGRLVAIWTERK